MLISQEFCSTSERRVGYWFGKEILLERENKWAVPIRFPSNVKYSWLSFVYNGNNVIFIPWTFNAWGRWDVDDVFCYDDAINKFDLHPLHPPLQETNNP